jgi:hypothetical protein
MGHDESSLDVRLMKTRLHEVVEVAAIGRRDISVEESAVTE